MLLATRVQEVKQLKKQIAQLESKAETRYTFNIIQWHSRVFSESITLIASYYRAPSSFTSVLVVMLCSLQGGSSGPAGGGSG